MALYAGGFAAVNAHRVSRRRWLAKSATHDVSARDMKFGLFFEIPVARPWTPTSELDAYRHTLEQAILADQVGFHSVWSVERYASSSLVGVHGRATGISKKRPNFMLSSLAGSR